MPLQPQTFPADHLTSAILSFSCEKEPEKEDNCLCFSKFTHITL